MGTKSIHDHGWKVSLGSPGVGRPKGKINTVLKVSTAFKLYFCASNPKTPWPSLK